MNFNNEEYMNVARRRLKTIYLYSEASALIDECIQRQDMDKPFNPWAVRTIDVSQVVIAYREIVKEVRDGDHLHTQWLSRHIQTMGIFKESGLYPKTSQPNTLTEPKG